MAFKPQRVKTQNIEIKRMLTTVLKMGCRWVALYLLCIYRHLYVRTYLSNNEYEENLFIFRIKRVLARVQNLDCKRLDIYLQIHTHHSSFFYKYSLQAFCGLEIIFHMFLHMKNGSGFLILLALYHSICWSCILIAKLLVIGYFKYILNCIITMKDFQRYYETLSTILTFQSKPYVCVFRGTYNVSWEKTTYYVWCSKADI